MKELDLIQIWQKLRQQIMFSQLAPTFLLIVTIGLLLDSLAEASLPVRLATLGILLASGIFGFLAQYSCASEAQAVIADLKALPNLSRVGSKLLGFSAWINVVRFVTPTIFIFIFAFICIELLG